MNDTPKHPLSSEELQLELELKEQAKRFKTLLPENLEQGILKRLQAEHLKASKKSYAHEWLKLAVAAALLIGLGLGFYLNSLKLNARMNESTQTISLGELLKQAEERLDALNNGPDSLEDRGKRMLAATAQNFISDLAILTFDPKLELMSQQTSVGRHN